MADMFRDVVEPAAKVGSRRGYSVPLSMIIHGLIVVVAIVVPLVAPDVLPMPRTILAVFAAPAPPALPPPPLPRPAAQRLVSTDAAAAPIEAPTTIAPETSVVPDRELVGAVENGSGHGLVPVGAVEHVVAPSVPQSIPPAPVHTGGDVRPPAKIKDVRPVYPLLARTAKVEGIVIIEATIGRTGKVEDAKILRSHPMLEAAALDAVRQWEFTPTLLNGSPVPVIMTVTVNFTLR
jgi:protein TonB